MLYFSISKVAFLQQMPKVQSTYGLLWNSQTHPTACVHVMGSVCMVHSYEVVFS